MTNTRPLTTHEAAEYLGLQPATLEAWRVRGCGPRFTKLGRSVRYRVQDLDTYLAENTCTSTSHERGAA